MANPAVASREVLKRTYLTWVNDFLTMDAFAEYLGVTRDVALALVAVGKLYHHEDVLMMREFDRLCRDAYLCGEG